MNRMSDNVVVGDFSGVKLSEKEEESLETLFEYIKGIDLDSLIVIGKKGDDNFMAHTNISSRTDLIGSLEILKTWIQMRGLLNS